LRSRLATFAASPCLRDLDRGDENNLNLLRFIAATLVVFSHSYALSGHAADEPLAKAVRVFDLGALAVVMFFALSGFLVARSFDRSTGLVAFVRARALRIFPAFAVAVAYAALVLGPLVTNLTLREYLVDGQTWHYVRSTLSLFGRTDHLPGVFLDNPYRVAVNGSLWTIALEVFCYGMLAVAGLLGILRRPRLALAVAIAIVAAFTLVSSLVALLPRADAFSTPRMAGTFVAGALAYVWRDPLRLSPLVALAGIVATPWILAQPGGAPFAFGAIAYATLVLAWHPAFDVPAFRRFGDTSYGIYVYAFPTQQAIASVTGPIPPWLLFAFAYPAIVALASASWSLVERPALGLKHPKKRASPFLPGALAAAAWRVIVRHAAHAVGAGARRA
jgi:peptidoglycan/LPS O-acetylase OafA/YrhL